MQSLLPVYPFSINALQKALTQYKVVFCCKLAFFAAHEAQQSFLLIQPSFHATGREL